MKKIVLTNVVRKYNFGGPSILYGIVSLLDKLYGSDVEIIFIEATRDEKDVSPDVYPFKIYRFYMLEKKHPLRTFLGYKGINGINKISHYIKDCDLVIDLYGICFCDNILRTNLPFIFFRYIDFGEYSIDFIAKFLYKKRILKNSSSFGPINELYTKSSANFICKRVFNEIIARERKSENELKNVLNFNKRIFYSPDIANLMPYEKFDSAGGYISLSISHQIIRQWKSDENYYDCIVNLCEYIHNNTKERIVFVPNEYWPGTFNDVVAAEEIKELLSKKSISVEIFDPNEHSALELKNIIANSDALIGSRYHSCVAALSSGVPTLTIGWHYKYEELLQLYNQEKWLISNNNCGSENLIKLFEEFWKCRNENASVIKEAKKKVDDMIFSTYKSVFNEILEAH